MKYKMHYLNGAGEEYDGGIWDITRTPKTTVIKVIEQPFFESNCPEVMRIKHEKERSHCLRDWEDGTFTLYPFQSGVPHIFEPIS